MAHVAKVRLIVETEIRLPEIMAGEDDQLDAIDRETDEARWAERYRQVYVEDLTSRADEMAHDVLTDEEHAERHGCWVGYVVKVELGPLQ